ncbi:glycosyltransferase family 2 protein [Bacillus timonensis]|uniref:glycosyltransferase family 2 protein n=1 Tax=Bacillus timonensis TaxID=1033734 RepID=UPI00028A3F68|nr:glycosyltransferase family A protein [Bacillus timonensis]
MFPKVSVVVPVYKVEKYIDRCLKSIVNQTYTNLEIILVNDGSPDNCGTIVEKYAEIDLRVIALHKENGGLSDARNFGMNYVTGEFTLFVDSDDWLEVDMVETMVMNSIKYKADVVQSAFYYAYENYLLFDNRYFPKDGEPIILDKKMLMKELVINEKVKNFAWGKLYKTKIIKDLPFEKGVLFEDVFWAHNVMHRVNTYLITHQPMYYYFQRSDSIVANYTLRSLDILKGLKVRHKFLENHYEDLINESYKNILKTSLIHYNLLIMNRKKDKGGLHRKEIRKYIKNNYENLLKAVESNQQLKAQLNLFLIHPLLQLIFLGLQKVLRKFNVFVHKQELEQLERKEVL